jgi:hypothetical protein
MEKKEKERGLSAIRKEVHSSASSRVGGENDPGSPPTPPPVGQRGVHHFIVRFVSPPLHNAGENVYFVLQTVLLCSLKRKENHTTER